MLDPFAGSGTTLIEAVNHQRQALGLEVNEKYVKISLERIKKECYSSQEEKFYFNEPVFFNKLIYNQSFFIDLCR